MQVGTRETRLGKGLRSSPCGGSKVTQFGNDRKIYNKVTEEKIFQKGRDSRPIQFAGKRYKDPYRPV